jgi:beta-lactam-binding protein with PASTA domain
MSFFKFLKTTSFFINLLLSSITAILLFWGILLFASSYTRHNITVQVPDFKGKTIFQLPDFIKDKKLRYQIIDSIYDPKQEPGIILRQDPLKGSEVKENRTIYLYVTSVLPPQVQMPKLVDRSLRQAIAMIDGYGLKPGKITYIADACKNCVIKQFLKGKEIAPGTLVKKASLIDLQVGKGTTNETVTLPNVIGLNFCDAKNKLLSSSLQVGSIMIDKNISDTCEAIVYRQTPSASKNSEVSTGAKIDLYITDDKDKVKLLSNDDDK